MGLFDTITKFFQWDAKNRATRMLQLHVFLLSIIVYVQFAVTQTYLNDKADVPELVAGLNTANWTESVQLKVLEASFPDLTPADRNSDSSKIRQQLINHVHMTCLPLWRTVEHEQTMFRIFLIIFTSIYALYSFVWMYNSWLKKDSGQPTEVPMLRVVETSIWILTQIVEVFFIVYGFLAFYHLYTNSLSPELYNDAHTYLETSGQLTAVDKKFNIHPDANCFALDKVLGGDLWGKHTPWIWDKMMMDAILMCVIFVLVFIRYILTALFVYDEGESDGIRFGINAKQAQAASLGYPMYNVVAMR
jgi:heme/copper-type cytochrome/quinol oxidase subunit 2